MMRLHTSPEPILSLRSADQDASPLAKPQGLWWARDAEWLEFIKTGSPHWLYPHHYDVELASGARLLKLESPEERADFTREFGAHKEYDAWYRREVVKAVHWEAVARQYDGIEVPRPRDANVEEDWLRFWDIHSGCVWNQEAIAALHPAAVTIEKNEEERYRTRIEVQGRIQGAAVIRPFPLRRGLGR